MADETTNPLTPSSDYDAQKPFWDMAGAILCGAEAMRFSHTGGKSQWGPAEPYSQLSQLYRGGMPRGATAMESPYLPRFENESPTDYEIRRKHAPFTNIYADISANLAAKPFARELALEDGSPADLVKLAENIDGQGNNLHVFARETFKSALDKGADWILIDYTRVPAGASLAVERNMGARPYWVHIPVERLIAVYSEFVGGQEVIYHARICEPITVVEGYSERTKERVRYLYREPLGMDASGKAAGYGPAYWELWEKVEDPKGDDPAWIMIDGGPITIGVIPLVPVMLGKRKGCSWQVEPPLRDLAYMQVEEFQQESNLKTIKELTAFPMLAGNGVTQPVDGNGEPMTVPVGPRACLFAPIGGDGQHGEWVFIEPSAESLTFLQSDLEKLRTEMRDLGMQPLATANLTVVTTANVSMKASSAVQAWALGLKDALERAWSITAMWLGQNNVKPVVNVHTDFAIDIAEESELTVLGSAQTRGVISKRQEFDELKRRGVLSEEADFEENSEEIAEQQEGLEAEMAIDPVNGKSINVRARGAAAAEIVGTEGRRPN